MLGSPTCRAVFARAALLRHLEEPPQRVVREHDAVRLHRALLARLGGADAAAVARIAGHLIGCHLLAHRIPWPAQRVLRAAPRPIAARLLTAVIARHTCTFAGSGRFAASFMGGLRLRLSGAPLCGPENPTGGVRLAATFETAAAAILGPNVRVQVTQHGLDGARTCTFQVGWKPPAAFPRA